MNTHNEIMSKKLHKGKLNILTITGMIPTFPISIVFIQNVLKLVPKSFEFFCFIQTLVITHNRDTPWIKSLRGALPVFLDNFHNNFLSLFADLYIFILSLYL